MLLLPTDHNKILMHWKGPFQVIESVELHDYRVEVNGKPKLFHINLLRKYTEREAQDVPAAVVIDTGEGDPKVEGEILIQDFDQQESHEDVELCPQLDDAKKEAARELFRVPGNTDRETSTLEVCHAKFITKDPVHAKGYPVPYATREIIGQEVRQMLQMIEPSKSPYSAPVVIVRKKNGEH